MVDNRTERTYDAISRLVGIRDPRGFVTAFRYDNANRVRQILDARNGQTQFSYDLNGNLLAVADAKSQTTTYTYDIMDRLATRKDALNRTETYQYDLAGNLTQFTDRKNQTTTFTYDALNRRTGATYSDATVTLGYDAINRPTSVNDSVGGTITWTYDTVSGGHHPRMLETTTPGTVTVEYDEIGRRFKLSATGLTDTTYSYDNNSRLTGVTQGTQTVTLGHDDAGRRTSLAYPNGVVTSYGYDNANRLLTINHIKTPTTIEALTYRYDTASNRVSLNRANAAASLIPTAVSSNSYDAANQQTQFNGVTQTFDANGNLTNDGTNTYTWDSRNRLTGISGGVTASFVYDGLGRRKSKTVGGATTGFWYDGDDILGELNAGTPSVTYIRGLNIDEQYIRKGVSDEFYQADGLGSSLALTTGAGASQTVYTYQPFGTTTQGGTTSTSPFQFTGRENDGTGIYNYRARYYSPHRHRFLTEDPARFFGGINFYVYVRNNPISLSDPYGLDWIYNLSDFSAGVGSALTFGLTDRVNEATGASGVVSKCSGWHTAGTVTGIALSTAVGAGGGATGLTGGLKGLSASTKGSIGEGLSMVENTLSGSTLLATRTRSIPGFRTVVDSTWQSWAGEIYYVESKFGTSALTVPQRLAADALGEAYRIERWGYDFFARIGGYTGGGLVLGIQMSGRKNDCE